METQYFDCQCGHFDHVVRFTLDPDDGDVWVETRLSHFLPWWKRLLVAVAYVFGKGGRLGHHSECQLQFDDYHRLHDLLDRAALVKRQVASQRSSEKPVLFG